jgi:hypothetical protein
MVKVKLIENKVKSHVGSVYDTQKRTVGSTLRIERIICPSTPKAEDGAASAAFIAARVVWTAAGAWDTAAAELLTSDVTASGTAMVDRVLCGGGVIFPPISAVTRTRSRSRQKT